MIIAATKIVTIIKAIVFNDYINKNIFEKMIKITLTSLILTIIMEILKTVTITW